MNALNAIVAGGASGLLMASIFICAAEISLFFLVKTPPPAFAAAFERFPPAKMALVIVVIAYPLWAAVGTVLGVLFVISVEQVPGGGLGSPNLVYTVAVVISIVMLAAPIAVLLRRVLTGVMVTTVCALAVFAWFLPYFAS